METYYVIKQSTCPVCNGRGMVMHPSWAAFWETGKNPTDENIERWFRDENYDIYPDEEITCGECDGAGVLRREVEMTDSLSFMDDRISNLEQQVTLITNLMNIGFIEVTK